VLDVIDAIPRDRGILFLPDFFLGSHVRRMRPDRKIEVWMGECHVHKGINPERLEAEREAHPAAEVLVHPECGCAGQLVYAMGMGDIDPNGLHIASTERMIQLVAERPAQEFIVATETGMIHPLEEANPDKEFIPLDRKAVCQYMKMITLPKVRDALLDETGAYEVKVPEEIAAKARIPIERMISITP
jgi:quinolinate synthase